MDDSVVHPAPAPNDLEQDGRKPTTAGGYQAAWDLRVGTRRQDGCVLASTGHWVRTEPEQP
jgi:hypothetical protein